MGVGRTILSGEQAPRFIARPDMLVVAAGLLVLNLLLFRWAGFLSWVMPLPAGAPTMAPVPVLGHALLSATCLTSLLTGRRYELAAAGLGAALAIAAVVLLAVDLGEVRGGGWSRGPLPIVSAAFILFGVGIALLAVRGTVSAAIGFALLSVIAGIALFRVLNWIAPPAVGLEIRPFNPVQFSVALLMAWAAMSCLLLHPRLGMRRELLRANLRGRILRYGFAIILALPLVSNAVAWAMAQTNVQQYRLLFASTASLSIIGGAVLVWWLAYVVDRLQARTRAHVAQLTRANEALERYASTTAHDLKAPIRHIRIYSELSVEALRGGDTEKAIEYAESNIESSDQLLASVERLLAHARTAFSQLEPAEHRVSEMLRAAASLVRDELVDAGAWVSVEEDAVVVCDGHLMESVFQNLLSNSVAHGGNAELKVRVSAERAGEVWRITYEDNGAGFDPSFVPKAFDYLARADQGSAEGSGIGLTTCKTILTRHGGDIAIDASFTEGARLVMTLPVSPVAASDDADEA